MVNRWIWDHMNRSNNIRKLNETNLEKLGRISNSYRRFILPLTKGATVVQTDGTDRVVVLLSLGFDEEGREAKSTFRRWTVEQVTPNNRRSQNREQPVPICLGFLGLCSFSFNRKWVSFYFSFSWTKKKEKKNQNAHPVGSNTWPSI